MINPWSSVFQSRVDEEELMDLPSTKREDFEKALYDIHWVNRYLNGSKTLIRAVGALIAKRPEKCFTVLDLGTGSADIPIALTEWGKSKSLQFEITAIDLHPVAVEVGQQITQGLPNIHVLQGDALHLDYPDHSFDIVTSSMFMHHLPMPEGVRLLQEMARLCRMGFIVNDLERSPWAYFAIGLLGRLMGKGHVFQHDAPLSVLRGFSPEDLEAMRTASGLSDLSFSRQKPYRVVLTWSPEPGESV